MTQRFYLFKSFTAPIQYGMHTEEGALENDPLLKNLELKVTVLTSTRCLGQNTAMF